MLQVIQLTSKEAKGGRSIVKVLAPSKYRNHGNKVLTCIKAWFQQGHVRSSKACITENIRDISKTMHNIVQKKQISIIATVL